MITKINFEAEHEVHITAIDDEQSGIGDQQIVVRIVEYPAWKNIVLVLMDHKSQGSWFWYMFLHDENQLNFSLWSDADFETRQDAIHYLINNESVVDPEFYAVNTVIEFDKFLRKEI